MNLFENCKTNCPACNNKLTTYKECNKVHYDNSCDHYFWNGDGTEENYITFFKDDFGIQIFLYGSGKYHIIKYGELNPCFYGNIISSTLEEAFIEVKAMLNNYANNLIFL